MGSRDWLSDWSCFARVLAEGEVADARAALVDTNGDGRELWFGLDMRGPSGEWTMVIDWDDVGGHNPVERVADCDVIFGWGTGQPRQRRAVDYDEGDVTLPIRVNRDGWWLLVANLATDSANTEAL